MSILRRIESTLGRTDASLFIRADFLWLGGSYAQVSRALQTLVEKGVLIRVDHGVYVKAQPGPDGQPVPVLSPSEIEYLAEQKRVKELRRRRRARRAAASED